MIYGGHNWDHTEFILYEEVGNVSQVREPCTESVVAQLEHIEAIEKRLWGAADTLRANSNYAGNEYFLTVMGLVFLRHAYSRYLTVKEKIEPNLPSQRNYYERIIRNKDELHRVRQYIIDNPVRWEMDRENPNVGNTPATIRL